MPITAWRFNDSDDRHRVAATIKADPGPVIEFGGACTKFYRLLEIDRCVDIERPWADDTAMEWEIADLNRGYCFDTPGGGPPFKWAVCTHTLEDLHWPVPLLEAMPLAAERGYLAMPSPFIEMTNWGGTIGFLHHRWIYTIDERKPGPTLVCWPKVSLIQADEFKARRDRTAAKGTKKGLNEIEVWWEGDLPFRVVSLTEDRDRVMANYRALVEGRWGGV